MKKILSVIIAILMLMPLAACTGDTVTEDTAPDQPTAAETETEKTTDTEKETDAVTETDKATDTQTEKTTEEETEKVTETEKETETETETEKQTEAETKEPAKEKTASVTRIKSWTFDDAFTGVVIGLFCETEPNATVTVFNSAGDLVLKERAIDKYFYGKFVMPAGKDHEDVFFFAQSDGKEISDASDMITLRLSDKVGGNAMIAHDSHVFLNWYRNHYDGYEVVPGASEAEQKTYMLSVKKYLEAQLDQVREKTGKKTKIMVIVCTNPATIYHEAQYSEAEGGWGDHFMPTSTTQFADYMKNDDDIYIIDIRQLLEANKNDRLLFMQADSHWTQVAAYYAYYMAAERIQKDFPDTKIYDLDKDFDVQIVPSGGDLLNFMGASDLGATAATASVSWKDPSMAAPETAPTAYVMGDSYYGAFSSYLDLLFSDIYLNNPETNPPLYDYTLEDLGEKQPDYLVYVWTERNIDGALGMLTSSINAGNIVD